MVKLGVQSFLLHWCTMCTSNTIASFTIFNQKFTFGDFLACFEGFPYDKTFVII